MTAPRIALIGAGRMARHHAVAIAASDAARLRIVVDVNPQRAAELAGQWGAVASAELTDAFDCDAAIVAVSTQSHFEVARQLLDAGVPVLVEKPLSTRIGEVQELVSRSSAQGVPLMCGFVERFNPALGPLLAGPVSKPTHVATTRVGPSPSPVQSSVVDDLLLHDLDLVLRLMDGDAVAAVDAAGSDWNPDQSWPDSVSCQLTFASGATASLRASRVCSARAREIRVRRRDGREDLADLLRENNRTLQRQFDHFMWLTTTASSEEQDRERQSVLPSHQLADLVSGCVARKVVLP